MLDFPTQLKGAAAQITILLIIGAGLALGIAALFYKPKRPDNVRRADSLVVSAGTVVRQTITVIDTLHKVFVKSDTITKKVLVTADSMDRKVDTLLIAGDTVGALKVARAENDTLRHEVTRQQAVIQLGAIQLKTVRDSLGIVKSDLDKAHTLLNEPGSRLTRWVGVEYDVMDKYWVASAGAWFDLYKGIGVGGSADRASLPGSKVQGTLNVGFYKVF